VSLQLQPHCSSGQRITVTALGEPGAELPGEVVSVSEAALHVLLDTPVDVGTAVKAECNDTLMLAEVCHCQPANGYYAVGLKVEHSLLHTTQLARLAEKLLEMSRGPRPGKRRAGRNLERFNPPARP